MQSKMPQLKQLHISRPLGGWTSPNQSGVIPQEGAEGQYSQSVNIDPFRDNLIGHISAGEIFAPISDVGGYVTGCPMTAAGTSDGNAFALLDNSRVVKFSTTAGPSTSAARDVASSYTFTGNTTNGSAVVSNLILVGNNTTSLAVGMTVTGTGIPANTTISSINSTTQVTLNNNATADGTGVNITFGWTLTNPTNNGDILAVKDAQTTPNEGLLFSWESGVHADIAYVQKSGSGGIENWFSHSTGGGVLTAGVPHRMKIGVDFNIYITNGQYISYAKVTGDITQSGSGVTGITQALNLGLGWVASAIDNYGIYLAIVAYKANTNVSGTAATKGNCRLILWDLANPGPNAVPNQVYDIPDNYASAIFNDNGTLKIFTQGRDNKTRVKAFGGLNQYGITGFDNLFEYLSTYIGNAPLPGSIDLFRGVLHWAGNGATAITSGINMLDGKTFHQPMSVSYFSNSSTNRGYAKVGLFKDLANAIGLVVGVKVTSPSTAYYLMNLQTGSYYPNSIWYSILQYLPYKTTIRKVKLFFSQFAAASSVQVGIAKDYNGLTFGGSNDVFYQSVQAAATVTPSTAPLASTDMVVSIPCLINDVSSFYMGIKFNHTNTTDTAAVVRAIIVEYEEVPQP